MSQSIGRTRRGVGAAVLGVVVVVALGASAFVPPTAGDRSREWPLGSWSAADWQRAQSREQLAYATGITDGLRTGEVFARVGVDLAPTNRCVERMSGQQLRELIDAHLKSGGGNPTEPIVHLRAWDALVAACLR